MVEANQGHVQACGFLESDGLVHRPVREALALGRRRRAWLALRAPLHQVGEPQQAAHQIPSVRAQGVNPSVRGAK